MTILNGLIPWEFQVQTREDRAGFRVRGYHSQPSGKPLLHFIHGNGFCGLTYEHLLAALQDDFDLFISDAQGHGESDPGTRFLGWDQSADVFIQVWQHFKPMWKSVPNYALGHSFGAVMSTLMMARGHDLFDAGVLMDPVYAPPKMAAAMSALSGLGLLRYLPLSRQARIRNRNWPSYQAAWDYLHQRGTFKGWDDACLRSYLDHALNHESSGVVSLKCPPDIEADIFASYPMRLWQAIRSIQKPIALFYGKHTYPFVLDALPKIHQNNLLYDFNEMSGGHCFMQERPLMCANEIKLKLRILSAYR